VPAQSVQEVIKHSDHLFERQASMVALWQLLADNFYPERADFTVVRNVGQELADQLIDSYPIIVRRDMGNSLSAMLRDGEWFSMTTDIDPDYEARAWLEWSTKRMMKFMGDRASNFTRATKEGDHDYVTFGQCVISVELNKLRNGVLYRCWHLRDCAWFEDETGQVCSVHRKWRPTYYQLLQQFGAAKLHPDCAQMGVTKPHEDVQCRVIVMPVGMYGDERYMTRFKYVRLIVDVARMHLIEVVPLRAMDHLVPRFQTVAGSQYAYSPATVAGLPDARLLQAMTHTLLEAGERYVRPPLIATQTVVRSDVDLNPNGITWVDKAYDERFGAALRPLETQRGAFPIGLEMRADIKEALSSAFYLNKINLPPVDSKVMTAYEVQERMKQFRRENLPLFAPIEADYNGQLCEITFELLFQNGMLGSYLDVPKSLQGRNVIFKFKSPLSAADEERKANRFAQMREILASAVDLDDSLVENVNLDIAMRDAIEGIGAPSQWLASVEQVAMRKQARQETAVAMAAAEAGVAE
jgi:hypothetical protein